MGLFIFLSIFLNIFVAIQGNACYNKYVEYWSLLMNGLKINTSRDRNGDIRYYLATTVRDGNKSITKTLKPLGKRSELLKIYSESELKNYLNNILKEALESGDYDGKISLTFNANRHIKEGDVKKYNVGEIFVSRLFNETMLGDCLDAIQNRHNFKYNLKDIVLFLLSQRLVDPCSKRKMYINGKSKRFLETDFSLENVYRGMDILIANKTEILKWLYNHIPSGIDRNYTVLYFDGTNTYMETEIEEGFKARGKGKRNEIEPLVSFALLLDGSGLPLSFVTFSGKGSECKQLIPLEEVIERDFKHTDFVMITDSALSSKEIRCFNSIGTKNYITVVPVRKMSEEKLNLYIFDKKKEWNTNNPNYKNPEEIWQKYNELIQKRNDCHDAAESIIIDKEISELLKVFLTRRYPVKQDKKPKQYRENPKTEEFIEEDYLISFSLNYALRDQKQRNRLIEKAVNLIEKEGSKKKYKPGDPRQYIKETCYTKNGEVSQETVKSLNETLIKKQSSLDGFYAVSTSLIEEKDEIIIYWMKQRWMIEDTFLIMKQFFGFRPINHSKDARIDAHFFTVFLTTLYYRYVKKICDNSKYESLHNLSDEELIDLLRGFEITSRQGFYFPAFENNKQQQDIQNLFNVDISREIMKKSYLNKEFRKKF